MLAPDYPQWSVMPDEKTPETPADNVPAETPPLGDAGKKALDAMKQNWHSERDQRKALEARIAELEAKPAAPSEDAIKTAIADVTRKHNTKYLRSEIKAAAKGVLTDPTDAFRYLDLDSFTVSDDGEVDESAVSDALAKLIESKPYLSAQSEKRFQGTVDGGARKASGPSQLTRSDLDGMSPVEIDAALAQGRLKNVLAGE